ncbi:MULTISPECIES: hypothetical protein [unclassified Brevundimonas]|uniref:hypothetical protein n=1 Tax=unclassified Brevundimonas TaxID=2622653 RepID=UPI000CFCB615|nr:MULTISPECIES: hypothetical protein [unclassified Brevundimonas]PRA24039.1 hypothetical protein CQ024_14805 [Brevundimonas sp. MYb27]PQZ82888.1 hypothetical protein CQ026_07825 [Brevundimonas sp. MYb31]PRB16716.1 hypothetical protein CQ039_03380 [Brevundimonas sp. MYb52]PRB34747.1 hypothetical protein CQ035_10345 [Brevundimonas sp. MYb46]PRB54685.1 hypothetical protein CQ028_03865 [Brevundimonas sp. MYb33]
MTLRNLARTLTPLGWLAVIGAGVLLVTVIGRGVGLRWDPFDLQQRRLETVQARAIQAETDVEARRLEAAARVQQAVRLETHQRQILAVERATVAAVTQARSAPDANDPLDPVRAGRLRAHDRELCRFAADLYGCAAASGPG